MTARAWAFAIALIASVAPVLHLAAPTAAADCRPDPGLKPAPCNLDVVGGEARWHSETAFSLRWRIPPQEGAPPVVAVHYRALDASGAVVLPEKRIPSPRETIDLQVPRQPGIYSAEVWLENADGEHGPPATTQLRFDDARPGPVEPLAAAGWIGGPDLPVRIRIEGPAGPQPLAGIRGYAVELSRTLDGDPCGGSDRCKEAEIDLAGGAADRTLWLGQLPEGINHLHVAAVSGSGMKSTEIAHAVLPVDTVTPVTALTATARGWTNRPVQVQASAIDTGSGMTASGTGSGSAMTAITGAAGPFTAMRIDGAAPIVAPGGLVEATVFGSGVHTVSAYARDAAGNVSDLGFGADSQTVRIDTDAPRLRFRSAQDPADPEAIEAIVSDPLSGPDDSHGQIGVRAAGSRERFEPLMTEIAAGRLRARWPSEDFAPGRYEFRATAYDRAGNAAVTIDRANGFPMVLAAPLKRSTSLGLELNRRAPQLLRAGRATVLSGRLVSGRRAPLHAMPVRLIERFDPGASVPERVTVVRTDSAGAFSARLAPGPSRTVLAVFGGTPTLSRSQSQAVRLAVQGDIRMRASSRRATVGGKPVVFAGRVASPQAALPAEGKLVELQFRLPGLAWSEFRTVRTDRRGRFRYAYRFADDDSRGVRFEFRAYAPAQGGWPYEPAGSRPIAVRGS